MEEAYITPMQIPPEMVFTKANTFTFATLCSIVGLNPNYRQLGPSHLKQVRRKICLQYHPDKSGLENANEYFMFYKDCLDSLAAKLESFTVNTNDLPRTNHAPRKPPPPRTTATTASKKPMYTNSRFQSQAPQPPPRFQSEEEFQSFLDRARKEDFQRNKHLYQYETQEQSSARFASSNQQQQQQQQQHAPRSAEEVNNYFTQLHQERAHQYQQGKSTARLAEEQEQRFAAYNHGLDTSGIPGEDGGSSSGGKGKFTNERFEEMLRQVGGGGEDGGSKKAVGKIKTVSLLSSGSSGSRLDFATTFYPQEDDEHSVTIHGNSRTTGMNVWDAHDPRKHLISSKIIDNQFPQRTSASDYERARKEDIFQYATSKQEQEALLQEREMKKQNLYRERLFRTYTSST